MEIDLSRVISYSKDSLQSRALMRSIMLDLYPGQTREMNVLLDVYESGVPRKIQNEGTIDECKYAYYVQQIMDDYGMQEQWAVIGLNEWIDVCLGKGKASMINYKSSAMSRCGDEDTISGNVAGGGYTNPIIHNHSKLADIPQVKGDISDYEIVDLGNGTIEIKKFLGFDQADTIVPTEISGKKVVGIGAHAFKKCKGIKSLIIPEGIEYISEGAFAQCDSLSKIVLPTSLKEIGKRDNRISLFDKSGTFENTAITEIDLPNGIVTIEDKTFCCCKNLTKISLPDNLKYIKDSAFYNCNSLIEVTLPSTVEEIGNNAFSGCEQLSKVILNDGLMKIGDDAFKRTSALTYLVIPKSVTEFGLYIFGIEICLSDIWGSGRYGNKNITLGCYPGSKAIEYARLNNLQIKDVTK